MRNHIGTLDYVGLRSSDRGDLITRGVMVVVPPFVVPAVEAEAP